jgi:beta-glucuronidase
MKTVLRSCHLLICSCTTMLFSQRSKGLGVLWLWRAAWLICIALPAIGTQAQIPAPLLQNVLHRSTISLNGDWHYIVDPHARGTSARYYLNANPMTSEKVVEYDFSTASTLRIPGDWNSQHPELLLYEGTVWYEKTFTYHPRSERRAFFYAGAANYRAHVWMNGQSLCEHEGGFTPFNCDATAVLKEGENFVVVSVDNTRHSDDVPALSPDWWNYGGLTRDVMIVEVPQTFIEDYAIQLERGGKERIAGWVRIAGASGRQRITIELPELRITREVTADSGGVANFAFDAPGLQLWSPENPKLYAVEIASDTDRVTDEIGFRSIEVRGTEILLNGRPVFLRGINMHEEAPYRSGRAKDLGCNFVRLAHYPHDEHTTRMADRMGLLLWSEIPVYQTIDWSNPKALEKARQQLTEMITRDRNRSSIMMWSVTNESRVTPERNAFIHELVTTARTLDSTRLITAAANQFHRTGPHTINLDDPVIADLDVFGMNEYIGWYEGTAADLDITTWNNPYNKPMIVSEFGGEAKQGLHGAIGQRWTEEYQENIYKHQIAALRKLPFMRGMTPWILKDFRSPHRQLPGVQDGYNRKGLISESGERKKAFFTLRQFYHEMASQKDEADKSAH